MDPAQLARDTLSIVDAGFYHGPAGPVDFAGAVRAAIDGTLVITPAENVALGAMPVRDFGSQARIEVTEEGTGEAAQRLVSNGPVTVLNFASACSVGGGFLAGAPAQEEELCRCSALFRCLEKGQAYYRANRAHGGSLYTEHAIWSPAVPFFRGCDHGLLRTPFPVSVITKPAPNTARAVGDESARIAETFRLRTRDVLTIAAANPPSTLVLGAWGCGAFGGDPQVVADAFGAALDAGFARAFERVVFAVLVKRWPDQENLAAFRRRFG